MKTKPKEGKFSSSSQPLTLSFVLQVYHNTRTPEGKREGVAPRPEGQNEGVMGTADSSPPPNPINPAFLNAKN